MASPEKSNPWVQKEKLWKFWRFSIDIVLEVAALGCKEHQAVMLGYFLLRLAPLGLLISKSWLLKELPGYFFQSIGFLPHSQNFDLVGLE